MTTEDYEVDDLGDEDEDLGDLEIEESEPADDASPDLADATEICGGDAELGQMLLDLLDRRMKGPAL